MDYEKLYKEALERAKEFYILCKKCGAKDTVDFFEDTFPELKESEDERIRKSIIELLNEVSCTFKYYDINKMLSWLEKQGECKETLCDCDKCKKENSHHSCQDITALGRCAIEHEQKPADEVKPKFKVGDWIISPGGCYLRILDIEEDGYLCEDVLGEKIKVLCEHSDCDFKSWTIQDAKDGDVLYCKKRNIDNSEIIMMYSGINARNHVDSYCRYGSEIGFNAYITNVLDIEHDFIIPATKEQCDLLLSKMKEAGYEWDDEKKELKKIDKKT